MMPAGVADPKAGSPRAIFPNPRLVTPVHVFFQHDAVKADAFIDLRRHRMLQQDAVHLRIGVQFIDFSQQFIRGGALGQDDPERFHADAPAGISLHPDVGRRCRIVADKDGGQNRHNAAALF